jgi:hypothetical protein
MLRYTPPMFASVALAARIERAESRLTESVVRAARCDLTVVTTQPGSTSQQNVHRQGFGLLYARALLVRGCAAAEP